MKILRSKCSLGVKNSKPIDAEILEMNGMSRLVSNADENNYTNDERSAFTGIAPPRFFGHLEATHWHPNHSRLRHDCETSARRSRHDAAHTRTATHSARMAPMAASCPLSDARPDANMAEGRVGVGSAASASALSAVDSSAPFASAGGLVLPSIFDDSTRLAACGLAFDLRAARAFAFVLP